ncbi:glycine betaine/L-proline ABC transporter substrate-binding protein ProX [Pseudodesulfovibrio sp. F-1]|uniref:Glycine betaine/L-proline ABC transporter substrate-binding protein ProX n=1 Tax=Pseudodesulfovibrio alkaliphilus TaxID=2661613 RepID=A0A7K1KKT0_9BACT|nr:glycine betaine/L-proline ABC transporter substrate-binding protein ProX [Pseudodesulfovibrio alkaliphilus]MUM76675.1 glycine betaine/L-proline ABC transporter substrate-binding protein ProX [Pseudodesulfovibrio alkaliphilus]
MKLKKILLAAACALFLTIPAHASAEKPGQGVTVNPARATWNTGFFQEALVRRGLEELGYTVKKPKDLANPLAYKSIALGDLDYWTNGWFPLHDPQLPADFADKCELIGYVAKAGGLQGYLVSKKHVEEFGIKSLEDFKRPEVVKAFDANGNGKADLTACPPGWGCETAIAHHMEVYGLKEYVNPIKASYEAGMAGAVGAFKSGEPVFFYTWTPNWTTYVLKPGTDVMWINVPEILPSEAQKGAEDRMTVAGVEGAVSDPIDLGFVVSDIRIAANKKFLADNPAVRKFFEAFTLPLADINAQNARMNKGEKSQASIEKHVDEWIAANKATWDGWLQAARDAAK